MSFPQDARGTVQHQPRMHTAVTMKGEVFSHEKRSWMEGPLDIEKRFGFGERNRGGSMAGKNYLNDRIPQSYTRFS